MKFKRMALILLLIAIMPAFFYTLYEFSSMSDSEELLATIYEQQMNMLLNNINQSSWERTTRWINQIRDVLIQDDSDKHAKVQSIIDNQPAIGCAFIADTTGQNITFFIKEESPGSALNYRLLLTDSLAVRKWEINRMIYRKKVGYDKPVTFQISLTDGSNQQPLVLIYSYKIENNRSALLGICINSPEFIESLPTILDAIPQDEIAIGIFNAATGEAIDKNGEITLENAIAIRKVWLFPNYLLAIKLGSIDLKQQAREQFNTRLKWTLFINSFLVLTIFIILRNIRSEMNLARIKSDFVSNVSHELRTPLALIRMYAETLGMGRIKTEDKKQEYYTVITRESERLSHLVNNILDFSKMESGKKKYNPTTENLNSIVADVMEMYSFHFKQKGFQYQFTVTENDLIIDGDRQGISEAVINLLDNAMKYSLDIKEVLIETGEDGNTCWVQVSDKGQGIPQSEQKKIFEKFYRVSTGLVHDTKGSGLGLSLVDYTMRAHKGSITVVSKPGQGSSFKLVFPKKVK